MTVKLPVALLAALTLNACAHETPPPQITYDSDAFRPAKTITPPSAPAVPVSINAAMPPNLGVQTPNDPHPPLARVTRANAGALQEPHTDAYLNATQVYGFSDGALYHLYAAPQQVSDVVLEPGETLTAISAGDTVRWAVGDTASGSGATRQVHVMVKPFSAGLKTNLVILTNRRTYHLVLESTGHAAMAAISWTYPSQDLIAGHAVYGAGISTVDTGVALDALNFRYSITGDAPAWRPLRAFDDGSKVYVEFPSRIDQGEAPPLFVVGAQGSTDLVNYRVKGNYYVVDQLFAAAELRLGADPQQVVRIERTDGKPKRSGLSGLFGGGSP